MNAKLAVPPESDIEQTRMATGAGWEFRRTVGAPLRPRLPTGWPNQIAHTPTLAIIAGLLAHWRIELDTATGRELATHLGVHPELSLQDVRDLLDHLGLSAHLEILTSVEEVAQIVEHRQRVLLWFDLAGYIAQRPSAEHAPNGLVAVHGLVRSPAGACDRLLVTLAERATGELALTMPELLDYWLDCGAHALVIDHLEPE